MIAFHFLLSSDSSSDVRPPLAAEHQPLLVVDVSVDPKSIPSRSLVIYTVWKKFWKSLLLQFVLSALSFGIIPALLPLFCLKYPVRQV